MSYKLWKHKHNIDKKAIVSVKKSIKNPLVIDNTKEIIEGPSIKRAHRTAFKVRLMKWLLFWSWWTYD